MFANNLWSNPAVRNEETVETENDGTERNDNVQTVSFFIRLDQFFYCDICFDCLFSMQLIC